MVLTPDSPFFQFFNGPNVKRGNGPAQAPADQPANPAAAPARP